MPCGRRSPGRSAADPPPLSGSGGGPRERISARGGEPGHGWSLQLGSARLPEFFGGHDPISRSEAQLIEEAIEDAVLQIDPLLIGKHRRIIGAAGTTGAVAALAQAMSGTPGGSRPVSHAEVRAVLDKLRSADLKKRKKMGVDPSRIDVIYAGTAILEGVMRKLRVEEMQVTTRGLRDGLMADLVRREVRPPAAGLHEENAVLEGLRAFGRRCGYREPHAEQVAHLSLSLFDQLRSLHRLGPEERALLHAAALLHDVGTFVSYNRHHKHGYYLLFYADLPGFTDRERELIATIARYHRRSVPKDRHEVFQLLTPAERVVVRGLAAILRVADGLDRGHRRQVRRLEVSRRAPGMRIDVWAEKGADLEVWSAQQKSELLAEVSGGPVRFRLRVVSPRR